MNWENTYRLPFLCTTKTTLWVFQFKFLHRRIATNDFFSKIGQKTTRILFFLRGIYWNPCPLVLVLQVHSKILERHLSMNNSKHYVKQTHCLLSSDRSWSTNWSYFRFITTSPFSYRQTIYFHKSWKLNNCNPVLLVNDKPLWTSWKLEKDIASNNNKISFKKQMEPS